MGPAEAFMLQLRLWCGGRVLGVMRKTLLDFQLGLCPIGSMYGIYGNIYHQHTPNVSIYIYIYVPYMDPMDVGISGLKICLET